MCERLPIKSYCLRNRDTRPPTYENLNVVFSPPSTAPCTFVVVTTGQDNINVIPVDTINCTFGTANSITSNISTPWVTTSQVAFSPTGSCFAVTDTDNGSSFGYLYTFTIGESCTITQTSQVVTLNGSPTGIAYSPDGSCLAVAISSDPPQNVNKPEQVSAVILYPVMSNCTLDTANAVTLNVSAPSTLAFTSVVIVTCLV